MPSARRLAPLVALGLGACSLTPPYHRPDAAAPPPAWRESPQAGAAADLRADWWKTFNSPELDGLMTRALAQNLDLAAAIARVEQANAKARIAGAPLLPSVDGYGQLERNKENVPQQNKYTAYDLGAQISYEVDFWGKNRSALNAAKETAIAAGFDREVVRLSTESAVANSFFQTIGLAMRVAVAQQNRVVAQTLLDGLRKEYRVGIATRLDVTQQETVVAAIAAGIPALQAEVAQSLDALAILIGEQPEAIRLETHSLDDIASPGVAPGLPSELLRRRPDVRESEAQLLSTNYDIGNARAQYFPDIMLTASGGVESAQLATLFTPQGLIYDLIASLTQPIFEGGKLRGQLDYARARYREQLADYKKAVISAFGDVETGLAAVARGQQALQQQQVALDKARLALRMIQEQFRAGTVNTVQVLQVEQSLFTQEDSLVQVRLNQLQALVSLAKALGGGWTDRGAPPRPDEFRAIPKPAGSP